MELKDIVLKKGDKVYFSDGDIYNMGNTHNGRNADEVFLDCTIVKIERPVKYETIYEAPKQILDQEEKGIIKEYLLPLIESNCCIIKQNDGDMDYLVLKLKREPNISFDQEKKFKGMKLHKEYTLEELGLFEGE